MNTTRRGFVETIALGTAAGVLAGTSLVSKRARAQTRAASESGIYDNGIIQLHQNESARGPGPKTMARPALPYSLSGSAAVIPRTMSMSCEQASPTTTT